MNKIKRVVLASGYKQTFLAKRLGVEQSCLSRMISGERQMPEKIRAKLSKILGVVI